MRRSGIYLVVFLLLGLQLQIVGDSEFRYNYHIVDTPTASSTYTLVDYIAINGNTDFLNHVEKFNWTGSGTAEDPFIIENYNITNNRHLFRVVNTDYHFILQNCWLDGIDNSWCGLYLAEVTNAIIRNITVKNAAIGMHMLQLNDSIIESCEIYYNTNMGIALELTCKQNQILNNSIHNNNEGGIWLDWFNSQNIIQGNKIHNNAIAGLRLLEDTYNNTITENHIFENSGYGIIALGNESDIFKNNITRNTASGILIQGDEFHIYQNIIWKNNRMGIWVTYKASQNEISRNTILNSTSYAIRMDRRTTDNHIHHNDFLHNGDKYQCKDDGANNVFEWNYYNPWNTTDANGDQVVDFPYLIEGLTNNTDSFPSLVPNTEIPSWYEYNPNEPAGIPESILLVLPAIASGTAVVVIVIGFVWWRNKPKE
ncbi:MAG: hypothetical protein BAJATHORv1_60013 [Candidatus Thorarchaeota archaeon]|nr:MAG: hypothetical protein BAJATHORv1_60013 [Candidatus Thorarchaeota archaeon]